jgi:hypothetical protein
MGDDERVEAADTRKLELAGDAGAGRPGVDEDRVAAGLQQRRVAVATYLLRGLTMRSGS